MYTRIKELADSAVALQNKINMEAALREISGICDMEHVTYGRSKQYTSEAAMIAGIQGVESPVFPVEPCGGEILPGDARYAAIGEAHTKALQASMPKLADAMVREIDTLSAVGAGKATLLTKKQRAAKK